jgi:hypothetical protein
MKIIVDNLCDATKWNLGSQGATMKNNSNKLFGFLVFEAIPAIKLKTLAASVQDIGIGHHRQMR